MRMECVPARTKVDQHVLAAVNEAHSIEHYVFWLQVTVIYAAHQYHAGPPLGVGVETAERTVWNARIREFRA